MNHVVSQRSSIKFQFGSGCCQMSLKIDTYSAKTSKVMECGVGFVFTKHGFKICLQEKKKTNISSICIFFCILHFSFIISYNNIASIFTMKSWFAVFFVSKTCVKIYTSTVKIKICIFLFMSVGGKRKQGIVF